MRKGEKGEKGTDPFSPTSKNVPRNVHAFVEHASDEDLAGIGACGCWSEIFDSPA